MLYLVGSSQRLHGFDYENIPDRGGVVPGYDDLQTL